MATYSLRQEIKSLTQSQEHTNFRPLLKHSCRWRKAPYPHLHPTPSFWLISMWLGGTLQKDLEDCKAMRAKY